VLGFIKTGINETICIHWGRESNGEKVTQSYEGEIKRHGFLSSSHCTILPRLHRRKAKMGHGTHNAHGIRNFALRSMAEKEKKHNMST